ncbi:hemicentin-1 [Gastrophryne carolinensis]
MYDDLVQVIDGASKILETSLKRPKKPLYNFALVPFHDPEIGPVTITTDPETFQNELKELYVQGGGDCPEMSVGAIKIALEISLPGSYIYVFTDARSKDYQLTNDVLQLIQQKQSQVVFVLTGDCDDRSHVGYKVYEEIASTSSGQVFHLDKKQVNEVLKWVEEAVQASKVHLVSTDHLSQASFTWEIPFDPSLKEVTVSLSGTSPNIELYDPLGRQMSSELGLNELLNIHNSAKVVNIKEPASGIWKIKTSSNGRHSVRITGVSTIDFRAGFSNKPTLDFSKTSSRPIQGCIHTYVLLNTTGLQHPARIDRLDLLTTSGQLLETIPVKFYPDRIPYEIWNVTEFIPPKEAFFLRVTGYDKDDYLFQRASSVSFSSIIPGPPKVSMAKVTPGYYLQPGYILCSVESLIPITIYFSKNGIQLGQEQKFQESVNASWIIANVSSQDEGYYTCFVSSSAGTGQDQTFLDVNEPPPVIKALANITISPGKSAVLTCDIKSNVGYNVTWLRNNIDLRHTAISGIHLMSNNSLNIKSVNISDEGEYVCSATNEGGTSKASVILTVQDPPRVIVEPKKLTFTKGSGIKLKCIATGYPLPQIVWIHNDMFLTFSSRYVITEDGSFIIKSVIQKDSGVYTCLATNIAGTDSQTAILQYIEAPVITVARNKMLVAVDTETIMECKASGIPKPHVDWFKDDVNLKTSSQHVINHNLGSLKIEKTQYSDAGEYICEAQNDAGKSSEKVTLIVGSAPVFTLSPSDVAMDIGNDVMLPCAAEGFPEPKITWRKLNGTSVILKPHQRTGTLQITNLWLGDDGLYICEAENQFGKIQTQANVTITGLVPPAIGEGPSVINVIEGNQVTLPCILLSGNPIPVKQWLKNNEVLVSNPYVSLRSDGSLHLESVHLKDSGEYVCMATNAVGTSKKVTTVNVYAIPIIQHGPQIFSIIEGNAIYLPCKATGVPTPSIIWKKGGESILLNNDTLTIESDGSLFLATPSGEDSGEYSCTAINAAGSASRKVQLTVYVKPKIINAGSGSLQDGSKGQIEVSAKVNDNVVLPCEVKSVPPPFITWAKEKQLISPFSQRHSILPSGSMEILRVKVTDAGLYTCAATNIAGNVTQLIKLSVYEPPRIQQGPQVIKINVKQSFDISCVAHGIPAPTITWLKDGGMLSTDFTFRVHSAKPEDAGMYTCIASNLVGEDSANVTVQVQAPPSLTVLEPPYDKTDQVRVSNEQVVFPCPFEGNPKPAIKWFHNNKQLTGTERGINITEDRTMLIIKSLTPYDNGEYKCVAVNEAGLTENKYNLKVLEPPVIKDKEGSTNVSVLMNHNMVLFCDATGSPMPLIVWYNGSTQVIEDDNVQILEKGKKLRILKTSLSHSGLFTCISSNIAGSAEKHFFVNVIESPEIEGNNLNHNISTVVGEDAKLTCKVKGIPFPIIQWFKDNRLVVKDPNVDILENGQILYIKNSHLSDGGQYKCVATNPAGSQAKQSTLIVNGKMRAMLSSIHDHLFSQNKNEYMRIETVMLKSSFSAIPPSIKHGNTTTELTLIVDSETQLECDAWGIPLPLITWYKDGKKIAEGNRVKIMEKGKYLQISQLKVTDAGKYICHVNNVAGQAERDYQLDIYVPASIHGDIGVPQSKKVIVGKSFILECDARGHPLPLITWLKEGVPIQINENILLLHNGKKLKIEAAVEFDQGQYTCVVTNVAGEAEMMYNVDILVPPEIEDGGDLNDYTVIAGSPAELECYVTGTPLPNIMWVKNEIPLEPNHNLYIEENGQKLIVPNSDSSDSGVYECIVTNKAGTSKKSFNVDIHVRPYIKPEQSMLTVLMHKPISLQCVAIGIPNPQITWLKNGKPFNVIKGNIAMESFGRILHFKMALLEDAGTYTCVATNSAGEATQEIRINVYEPPKIENSDEILYETVLGNQPVRLECKASGNPYPAITWSKDNYPIKIISDTVLSNEERTLQITAAQIYDAGIYKCVASSIAGIAELTYVLQVHVLPSIIGPNEPITVIVNNPVTLECEATGFPAPMLTWLKDGIPVSSSSGRIQILSGGRVLTIANVQLEDTGKYTCVAVNAAGDQQKDFDLSVYLPPNIIGEEQNVTVLMSENLILKCESNAIPPPVLTWFKDWKPLANGHRIIISENGHILQIENAQTKDTGHYSCKAVNVAGKTEKNFNVNILVPSTIKGSSEELEVTVIEGAPLSLVCESDGNPPPALTWKKNDIALNSDLRGRIHILSGGRQMQIAPTIKSDSASYTCIASNTAGSTTKKFNVKVYVRPAISGSSSTPMEVVVTEGNNATLECDSSGNPQPIVTWLRDGAPLGTGFNVLNNGRHLQIGNAQVSDSGLYVCVAVNVAGQSDKKYDLKVFVFPKIGGMHNDHENISVVEKNPVTLTCEVTGIPPPKITWYKDGKVIYPDNTPQLMSGGTIFRLLHTAVSDAGTYQCVASNAVGTNRKNFHLHVLEPPRFTGNVLEDVKVKEKTDVVLSCEVTGNPVPQITWLKDGNPLVEDIYHQLKNRGQQLHITNAMVTDTGRYICIVSNSAGDKSRYFSLGVRVPPIIVGAKSKESPENISVILHSLVSLSCEVHAHPSATILWYKDGHQIHSKDNIRILPGGRKLQILKAHEGSFGNYSCVASNEAGIAEHHYSLNVYSPPRIAKDYREAVGMFSKQLKVKINTNFTLECSAMAFPMAKISWYKDGQLLDHEKHMTISDNKLYVEKAELSDTGRYTCVAANVAGKDESKFDVTIQVPPNFPKSSGLLLNTNNNIMGISNLNSKNVIVNNPFTLYCETNAIPPPIITWYKDGKMITSSEKAFIFSGGNSLQIARANVEDAGTYSCVAVNEAGKDSLHYTVQVLLPPIFEGENGNSTEKIISLENETVLLDCTVKSNSAAIINWQKDGQVITEGKHYQMISDGRYLQIFNTQLSDSGRYVCIVENVAGSVQKLFNLNIHVPPKVTGNHFENETVVEGNSISLVCEATGFPAPAIKWIKDGIVLSHNKHIFIGPGGWILQIPQAKQSDGGEYICLAINKAGESKKTFQININVPPAIVGGGKDSSTDVSIQIGTSVSLECNVHGIPAPIISWYKNADILMETTNHRIQNEGQLLNIRNVQVSDYGEYECVATNVAGQDRKKFVINVYVPPHIQGPQEEHYSGIVQNPLALSCKASGNPTPTLTWLKDGNQISFPNPVETHFLSGGAIMRITRAQLTDTGNYTCLATNTAGTAQKNFILTIQVPPSITGSGVPNVISAIPSQDVQLMCKTEGVPVPLIHWLKDGKRIDINNHLRISKSADGEILLISNVQRADMGRYACVAINSAGEDDRIFDLNVYMPPKIAGNEGEPVTMTAVLDTSVNIECIAAGDPTPQVNWLKNGLPLPVSSQIRLLSSGQILRISKIHKSDGGSYTCVASSRAGVDKKDYILKVYIPPTIIGANITEQLTTILGNPTTMRCIANGHPEPQISWSKDGIDIDYVQNKGMVLQIHNTEMNNTGRYTCTASNEAGRISKHFILNVLDPPRINGSGITDELTVIVNNQLDLLCYTTGFPPPEINWLKDGQLLSQTGNLHFIREGQILRITSAQEENIGLYTCLVSNSAGNTKKEFSVNVHKPPSFAGNSGIHTITSLTNKHVILECPIDALPAPEITWLKNRKSLMPNFRVHVESNGRFLHIHEAELTDAGRYVCVASNVAGKTTREFMLNIYAPPVVKDGPNLVTTFVNKSANLECAATGVPPPRISWRKNGVILNENNDRYAVLESGSLYFSSADTDDAGQYSCLATNAAGSDQKQIELLVYDPPLIKPGPTNITTIVNHETTLPCEVTGTPKPKVKWEKHGRPIDMETNQNIFRLLSSGSLTIISATVDDSGVYDCSATNAAGHDGITIYLSVLVPPSVADEVTNIFVNKLSSAVIPCTTYGVPQPTVSWLKDGVPLSPKGEGYKTSLSGGIEILQTDSTHAGKYTCTAVNEVGSAQIHIHLHIQEVPVIHNQVDSVEAIVNRTVTLFCEAEGIPSPSITWQKEGVGIKTGGRHTVFSNGNLNIANVTLQDHGTYTCIAQNPAGMALGKIKLRVYEPPSITPHQTNNVVVVDESVTMICEAYGNPTPEISWYKDSVPITKPAGQRVIGTGTLQITYAQPDDAGTYMCTAENIAGSISSSMSLSVLVPPQILKNKKELSVIRHFQVSIPCNVQGIPVPTITWTKDDILITNKPGKYAVTKSGELVLLNAEHSDAGNYTCTAINLAGKDSHTVFVSVQFGPYFIELPLNVSLNEGERLRLSCKAAGNPLPQITWNFRDKYLPVQTGQSKHMNDLVIENVAKKDGGTYTCTAKNAIASIHSTSHVFVNEPPVLIGVHPRNQTVPLGGSIILDCAVQGNPTPQIQWSKKENDIPSSRRFKQFSNGSLAIYNTQNEDNGDYLCIATNDAGTMEHSVTLILQKPPIIKIPPSDRTVNAGATVVFDCKAEGEPVPTIAWSRLTHPIFRDHRFTVLSNGSLKIVAARKEDTSMYECSATNIMGTVVSKFSFTVQVHGRFSEWLPWQSCSASCGQGVQKRMRLCNNPAPANGGLYCEGEEFEIRDCQNKPCPADGVWSDWSSWEECSKTCGGGKKTRTRTCNIPSMEGEVKTCDGKAIDTTVCNIKPCPVDGKWSSWQAWNPCSKTCGKGTQTRIRLCNNPPPSSDGTICEGQEKQTQICYEQHCPVDGNWSAWGSWTACSVSCGGGLRQRTRECSSPAPQYGGHKCEGNDYDKESCNRDLCPVNGNWGSWSSWSSCSRTCNGGQRRRYRVCDSPAPLNNGRGCVGMDSEMQKCSTEMCNIGGNWGPWEAWSECSLSCGGGQQIRTRSCEHSISGMSCTGESTQLLKCNVQACQGIKSVRGTLVGTINDVAFGISRLNGTIYNLDSNSSTLEASYNNIPKSLGSSMRILTSLLNPIYWTEAKEIGGAANGFTLNNGVFLTESQVEFATGELMKLTHKAHGLDANGSLVLDTVVKGYIPQLQETTKIKLKNYTEDFVQTGLGQLYVHSTRTFYLDDVSVPYTWSHSVSYDPSHGQMPHMVETLLVSSTESYNQQEEILSFKISASISKGDLDNQCPHGFSYDVSGLFCADDNECTAYNQCSHSCHNVMGSYYCSCPKGFMIAADGRTCHDIDECTLEDPACRRNQECKNTIGLYVCVLKCGAGFTPTSNGRDCQDINECKELSPCHQRCFNTIGSYHCGCEQGYHLKGRRCFDLNECRQNVCRPDQLCKNTRGSYKCIDICPSGLTKGLNGSCIDIDECTEALHRCTINQICENTHGSYRCACPNGFKSEGSGKPCTDIDECERQDLCQHECRNIIGSYQCICPSGYQLMTNGKTCQDIDECLVQNVQCGVNQMCFNMRGSFQCIDTPCPPNYLRDFSGYCLKNCAPNDLECALNTYALQYKLVSLPRGIAANQDLIRLVAYTQDGILHPKTTFIIIDEDPALPFSIREENLKGVVFTNRPLREPDTYRMKVKALSYSKNHTIEYQTTFIVYISVSPYPY